MAAALKTSIADLIAKLEQAGGRAVKAVNDQMQAEATGPIYHEIFDRMPVDEGNLEDSLKVKKVEGSRRQQWEVYVDGSMPDDTGKYTVGDYAPRLNEDPTWNPGPKSEAKGPQVGPKFMERGLQAAEDGGIIDRCRGALRQAVGE
jgi:hypothetical protein